MLAVFDDLRKVGCDFLSLGQYLSAGGHQYPVKEYLRPQLFDDYKTKAQECGFAFVASAPYVRSSYLAHQYLAKEEKNEKVH